MNWAFPTYIYRLGKQLILSYDRYYYLLTVLNNFYFFHEVLLKFFIKKRIVQIYQSVRTGIFVTPEFSFVSSILHVE
jgi:hypothetical protein